MADPIPSASAPPAQQPSTTPRVSKPSLPVKEKNRVKDGEIRIKKCTIDDMPAIVSLSASCPPQRFI